MDEHSHLSYFDINHKKIEKIGYLFDIFATIIYSSKNKLFGGHILLFMMSLLCSNLLYVLIVGFYTLVYGIWICLRTPTNGIKTFRF